MPIPLPPTMARLGLVLVAALLLMVASIGHAHPVDVRFTAGDLSSRSIDRTSDIIPDSYVLVLTETCGKRCQQRVQSGLKLFGCTKVRIHPTIRFADALCPKRRGFSPLCAIAALPGVESVEPDRSYHPE